VIFGRNGGPPLQRLVKDANADAKRLARGQVDLVRARFAGVIHHARLGGALLVGAAVVGLFAVASFLATVGLALALVLPGWAAAFVLGALLVGIGALLAALGRSQLRAAAEAKSSGPPELERDLADTRYRLEAELEAISNRLDPRPKAHRGSNGVMPRRDATTS
jgi:hypothetical protein